MAKIFATPLDLSSLSVVAPPEAAPVKSRLHVWAPVPGLSTGVASQDSDENRQLVNSSVICPGDPRFIRMRKVLKTPADSEALTWADGSPVGFRVSAPIPDGELAQISLQKV